jgi:hypothetical protein
MKFSKRLSICLVAVVGFLGSLQGENQVKLDDPQVIKQQAEDLMEFIAIADPWGNAIAEYSRKNGLELKIRCKNCTENELNIGEFNGCLIAWVSKAILGGHETFKQVKTLADEFIRLLSSNASTKELENFMLKASNDMKQVCSNCHGVEWEKVA